jgi:hypothetical protein
MSKKPKRGEKTIADILESIPSEIDFGYWAVDGTETRLFTITNITNGIVKYSIKAADNNPFEIAHASGVLQAKGKQDVSISYMPKECEVLLSSIIVNINGEEDKTVKLLAVSKYPLISVSQTTLDFQELLVGKSEIQEIQILNIGQVPAHYKVSKEKDEDEDTSFNAANKKGLIPVGESATVKFKFQPKLVGVCWNAHYSIRSKGGNYISISCFGLGIGYDVHLSAKSMNFGEVSLGNTTNRLVNVVNNSDLATSFQFLVDKTNLFAFSISEGVVSARGSVRVIITFNPQETVNYHERVFCLIRNHKLLHLDLIGTWYSENTKPLPLMQRHVDMFRYKVIMGIHYRMKQEHEGEGDDEQSIQEMDLNTLNEETKTNVDLPVDDQNHVLHKEMFLENDSPFRDILMKQQYLDFNYCEYGKFSEAKQIEIENKLPYNVEIKWYVPEVMNSQGEVVKNPFSVDEKYSTIKANSTGTFHIKFKPFEPDYYFFQVLQCFVYLWNGNQYKMRKEDDGGNPQGIKTMTVRKTHRSTKASKFEESIAEEIDPPLWLNLRIIGHSFNPGSQPFIPMVKFLPTKSVVFPPCGPGESVYQTIKIMNTSDTPVFFKMLPDPSKVFRIFPLIGLIQGKSFALICFEFSPKSANHWSFTSQWVLNYTFTNVQNIHLSGKWFKPEISLSNKGKLFFPPTYTGVSSKQKLIIKNNARIPLEYDWLVPNKYKDVVLFDPPRAVLQANEEKKISCTFTPLAKREYSLSIPMQVINVYDTHKEMIGYFNPGSGIAIKAQPKREQTKYELRVFGVGNDGDLSIKPSKLDFDTVTVGFSKILSLTVINKSKTNLYIDFHLDQIDVDHSDEAEQERISKIVQENFKFDFKQGIVPALSKKQVKITFKPSLRFDYNIKLSCNAREKPIEHLRETIRNDTFLCQKYNINIMARGDYPLLRFADIRNDQMSVSNLWEKFQLTLLNKELLTVLNKEEIEYSNSERKTNQSVQDLQKNLKVFSWDFGKVPIKYSHKPRKVTLTIRNVGGVSAEWVFKMPNDSEIELEPWADPGEPTPEQAFEQHILENNIFMIEPKVGTLAPGEQTDVNVYYVSKEVDFHHLKVFLQISHGKPLLLHFKGETLSRRAHLRLCKDEFHIPPVPIGLEWSVTYPIEIKNLGITKLKYKVDLKNLEKLNWENFDFKVFEIDNPEGVLMPNEIQYLYTMFRPLESKKYHLELPIKVSDIEGVVQNISLKLNGVGYQGINRKPKEIQFYEDLPKWRAHCHSDDELQAAFSIEEIDFGEVDPEIPSKRIVILYNMSSTQKLNFEFFKTGLLSNDNINLMPISGELEPNSHKNIKMVLKAAHLPVIFDGEIMCQIEWEENANKGGPVTINETHTGTKSVVTHANENEFLFIRLKKRSCLDKYVTNNNFELAKDPVKPSLFLNNLFIDAMDEVLEDKDTEQLFQKLEEEPVGAFPMLDEQEPPTWNDVCSALEEVKEFKQESNLNTIGWIEQFRHQPFENEIQTLTGLDEDELFNKRILLDPRYSDLIEYMLEDTMFNLMEEGTYEEFDLSQIQRVYIKKEALE